MKRSLFLVGPAALLACGAALAGPAQAHSKLTVSASAECGRIVYHVQSAAPIEMWATDVSSNLPLTVDEWTAPAGKSTHTTTLIDAWRPVGPDRMDLFSGPTNDSFVRSDSVGHDCLPGSGSPSHYPTGRNTTPGGNGSHQATVSHPASHTPKTPCITPSTPTTPVTSPPATTPATTSSTTLPPAASSSTPPPVQTTHVTTPVAPPASTAGSPGLAETGSQAQETAGIGGGLLGLGIVALFGALAARRLRRRGEHS